MARHRTTDVDCQPREKRMRGCVLGLGVTAGAFFAFGMTPLVTAPAANADEFDVILDPIINSLSGDRPHPGRGFGRAGDQL